MGRIQRTQSNEQQVIEVQGQSPQEIKITLSDGTITVFRPVVLEDVRSLAKAGITNEIEAAGRLIARNCVRWGDKSGIALPQLRQRDIEDVELISETLAPKEMPEFVELSDRSKSLTLSNGIETIFRRPNYGDAEAISKQKDGDLETQVAIALRLCVRWGDRDGVDEKTLNSINMGDWQGVAKLLQSFRRKPQGH
ncbi:hypothetical protein VF14_09000 [Nostoc linckia z18]|uniref:Uncharacterized protein n=2 Tax=Nostoc linckia TaxID=92942 RepID=A0A9Q5ZEC4_NOSLI|nr:hypothetical protein [Nostoc linckia]PHK32500.1 hypothetical protein VF12_26630 [Nostoc linckia z15]PHK44554.1 hypothetical protein VF13_21350 [Nostoc linckia z16]PHJ59598.1 hypothetical protein VF02_24625 [Nostoc linckia z1]PHJ65124.1 hypothetical protein VF05_21525 [Nostoc linckia z3]PHJ69603.1 hypothetical protein VF03_23705 [Nostoc linckia z2]